MLELLERYPGTIGTKVRFECEITPGIFTIMKEFNLLRGFVDEKRNEFVDCATYGEIKTWFLLKFPEIEEYNKKVEELRIATRKANEERKAS